MLRRTVYMNQCITLYRNRWYKLNSIQFIQHRFYYFQHYIVQKYLLILFAFLFLTQIIWSEIDRHCFKVLFHPGIY